MITWEYFAGFLDGDGWITCTKNANCRTVKWVLGVTQLKREERAIHEIRNFLTNNGAVVQWIERISSGLLGTKTPMVDIRVSHQDSLILILEKVTPSLLIKRSKAEDCLRDLTDRRAKRGLDGLSTKDKQNKRWSKQDLFTMRRMHRQRFSNHAIAVKLGRTYNSISQKLNKLELTRSQ